MTLQPPEGWNHEPSWKAACIHLERLAAQWSVSIDGQLAGATCSLLARGWRGEDPVVLKVALSKEERISGVPAALSHADHGGIEIWEFDYNAGALLMPLAEGPTLDQSGLSDDEHLAVQAEISLRLQGAPHAYVWSMDRWFESLINADTESAPLAANHVRRAQSLFFELERTTKRRALIHGDLHHFNIIRHRGSWVAIDPKGMWCDPSAEVGAYLRNIAQLLPTGDELVSLTRRRLDLFHYALGEPWDRLWGWGYVIAVISALWASEDFLPPWTELVAALARLEP